MKAAIIKDFLSCRLYLKTYAVFSLVFMVVGIVTNNPFYSAGIFMIVPVMCLTSTFALDENSKWERLALCSTLSRKDLVNAKYAVGFILMIVGFALNLFTITFVTKVFLDSIATSAVFMILSLFYMSALIPLMFKFGAEKSRIYTMGILVVPAVIVLGLVSLFETRMDMILSNPILLISGLVILFIVLLIISYFISIKIVSKKDY
ncbi:ABC-2 transporter permease [Anaerorhabdus sp.]|uniref:ABC-2 transporter permease n=1 Tax=Anaerorhabdus sp. TaxID=1872524 RepID=UPI002FC7C95F